MCVYDAVDDAADVDADEDADADGQGGWMETRRERTSERE